MPFYEFKVVPAPRRGTKTKGLKTTEDRFAKALMDVMNTHGRDGWDYVRADVLPCDERSGLTGRTTTYQNMLVFRRELVEDEHYAAPEDDQTDDDPVEAANSNETSDIDEVTGEPRVAAE